MPPPLPVLRLYAAVSWLLLSARRSFGEAFLPTGRWRSCTLTWDLRATRRHELTPIGIPLSYLRKPRPQDGEYTDGAMNAERCVE